MSPRQSADFDQGYASVRILFVRKAGHYV